MLIRDEKSVVFFSWFVFSVLKTTKNLLFEDFREDDKKLFDVRIVKGVLNGSFGALWSFPLSFSHGFSMFLFPSYLLHFFGLFWVLFYLFCLNHFSEVCFWVMF